MSDFDTALERLLTEPAFARALAGDPAAALAGYRLSAEEVGLLSSQVSADAGGQHGVESRTNKSSVFGLLAPLTGLISDVGIGHAVGQVAADGAAAGDTGTGPIGETLAKAGLKTGREGFGTADRPGGLASLFETGTHAPAVPPDGYHTRVDVDGDGDWDRHTLRGRDDGGVDILVDLNRDGRADFVGHDDDADGLVESADYDKNHDRVFEKRMYDDNGDGWLDRTVRS